MFQLSSRVTLAALAALALLLPGCASLGARSKALLPSGSDSPSGPVVLEPEPSLSAEAPLVTEPLPIEAPEPRKVAVSSEKITRPDDSGEKKTSPRKPAASAKKTGSTAKPAPAKTSSKKAPSKKAPAKKAPAQTKSTKKKNS